MTKNKIGLALFGSIALVGACSYVPPTGSNNNGGEGGIGSSISNASAVSSGQGGAGSSSSGGAGSVASSSSSGGTKAEVNCGVFSCLNTTLCCIKPADPPYYTCAEPGTCENAEVRCDGPEDCSAGFACCGTRDGNGNYLLLHCAKECLAPEVTMCHPNSMLPDCPDTSKCSALPTLGSTYGVCE